MSTEATSLHLLSTLAGFLLVGFIHLILFLEFRDIILSKRIKATVIRIIETPSTDADGHERIDRFPEIEFLDPNGKLVLHKLAITNITWRKPGDKLTIYYRPMQNEIGFKICSPFMWPKLVLLLFLAVGASLLLFGTGG
ncbi:MAG: hypothetical protein JNM57_14815 [Cyclobacteriaceae bacterium]|nr:hypothetical protein [Cyclobacteriaceae bacterium]